MRILYILTQDLSSPSGIGRYFPLAKELAKLGNDIFLLALHPDFTHLGNKRQVQSGVNIHYVAPMHVKKSGNIKSYYSTTRLVYQSALATVQLTRSAWKIPADIVHIAKPHPMNGIAGLLKGIQKNQLYVDCDDDEEGSGVFKNQFQRKVISWFEREIPLKADFVTTNTQYTKNRLENFGVDPDRIIYLSSGVDMDRFHLPDPIVIQDLKNSLGLSHMRVIAYIGSLSLSSHPVDLLFQAFRDVIKIYPDTRLLVVGRGDDYYRLNDQAIKMDIARSVIFTGYIPAGEVVNYYYLSDLVVDPVLDNRAAKGRQPLKLFECWACEVPYVSSDVGDRKEILGSPSAGVLSRPGDFISLADAIIRVLSDSSISMKVRELGKERLQSYTWDKLAKHLNTQYIKNQQFRKP